MARTCPQCGTPNSDQANACVRCGFRFTTSAPGYGTPPTPPQGYPQGYQQTSYQQPPQGYQQAPQNYQQPQWQQYPQPDQYQAQPGTYPPVPAAALKPRRGPGRWIAIALIILVLVGGGGFAVYKFVLHSGFNAQDPASVLNAYCDDLKNNDYNSAYQLLSKNLQQQVPQQEFQLGVQLASGLFGGIKSCTISNVQVNGSRATAQVVTTGGNGKSTTATEALVLENGAWKLDKNTV